MPPDRDHEMRLSDAAKILDLPLTDAQSLQLLTFMAHMQRWNKTYNLTAIRDPGKMLVQHLFDSLSVVNPISGGIASTEIERAPGEPLRVVDVGSGGGLPGVVLAIMRPDWRVHCVDAVEKKTAFLQQIAGVLGLRNLRAVHARIETLAPLDADIVVSRAFASLSDFAILAGMHVAISGRLLAMKGHEPQDEVAALVSGKAWRVDRVDLLRVPELDAQRCLVWMNRCQGTI